MLLILYIVQAICNQTCRPGLQRNKYYWCFVFIYNIYHTVIYFYIFFLFLNKLWSFSKKNILIPNVAEKNILILVE